MPATGFLRRLPLASSVAACLAGPAPIAAQQPSMGPLTYEEGAPLQRLSFTPMTEVAEPVPRGRLAVEVWNGFSNIFEQDSTDTHVLFLDLERLVTTVALRWGVADAVEVGGRVTLETTGPGALDSVILTWHDWWGFGQANRDRFPEGVYRQSLRDGAGNTYIDIPRRTLGLEDVRLFAKWRMLRSGDSRSLLSLRGAARFPTNANRAARRSVDVAATVIGQLGVGSWYGHAMAGAATARASEALEPVLRSASWYFALGMERSLGSSLAAVAQIQAQSAVLRSFDHRELDRAPTNLVLGLAGRIGERWSWDASFQEDIPADTPAVDFTIGLKVRRSW